MEGSDRRHRPGRAAKRGIPAGGRRGLRPSTRRDDRRAGHPGRVGRSGRHGGSDGGDLPANGGHRARVRRVLRAGLAPAEQGTPDQPDGTCLPRGEGGGEIAMMNESYESDPIGETIDISVLKSTWSSPLDPAALLPVLAPIGQARTLPAEAYTSVEVHQWELANFFEGSWVCAGRSSLLEQPGDQTAVRVGTEGILLVRDADGELRGFYNVCRHRGHELLQCGATTNRRGIVCPYHAWAYGLDGRLRGAPRFRHLTSTDPVHEGLLPAAVSEWHGWLFVNPSGAAPP